MLRRVIPALASLALLSPLVAGGQTAEAAAAYPIKWGASTASDASFNTLNSQAGPLQARRTYNGALPSSFAKSLAAGDVAAKRTSYWSFKPDMKTFATNTAAQTAFSKFLDTIPAGHQTTIIGWHEPEDEIKAGKFTLKNYGDVQNKLGQIIDSKKRPELRLALCLMGAWTFDSRGPYYSFNWDSVLNWNYIDVVGIDVYKFRTGTNGLQQYLTIPNFGSGGSVPSTMQRLAKWGKPVALMEWGASERDRTTGAAISESTRAKFLTDAYAWMKSWNANSANKVKFEAALWFHLNYSGNSILLTGPILTAYITAARDTRS